MLHQKRKKKKRRRIKSKGREWNHIVTIKSIFHELCWCKWWINSGRKIEWRKEWTDLVDRQKIWSKYHMRYMTENFISLSLLRMSPQFVVILWRHPVPTQMFKRAKATTQFELMWAAYHEKEVQFNPIKDNQRPTADQETGVPLWTFFFFAELLGVHLSLFHFQ